MLVKKELLTIHADASIQLVDLPKSGRVLMIACREKGRKPMQFFSDGKNYIFYQEGNWTKADLFDDFSHTGYYSSLPKEIEENDAQKKMVKDFLLPDETWVNKVSGTVRQFIREKNREKREKAADAKYRMQQEHFAMFPGLPDDFQEWAEQRLFTGKYLFFSNKEKKKRRIHCTICGAEYEETAEVKHKTEGYCRNCGTGALYFAERYCGSIREKNHVCICSRKDNAYLFETLEVTREYSDNLKPQYIKNPQEMILYFPEKKTGKLYKYQWKNIWGYADWYRSIDEYSTKEAVVYDRNLSGILPGRYAKEVERVLQCYSKKINIVNLILNLERIPQTEYLLKMGMVQLAGSAQHISFENGRGFADVMGVPGHYKSLYRKMDITLEEHYLFKKAKYIIREENISQIRKYDLSVNLLYDIEEWCSMDKVLNYLARTEPYKGNRSMNEQLRYWDDYLHMMKRMDMLTEKNMFPLDIKKAHDRAVELQNARKREENREKREREEREFAERSQHFIKMAARCKTKNLMIKVAATAEELEREGAELHHCVGSGFYWDRHVKGKSLICFIRKRDTEDTPYFTLEIDLDYQDRHRVSQLYGSHNCKPNEEIRDFAEKFVTMIQPRAELRQTGT